MIECMCLEKIRNKHNQIVAYRVQSSNGIFEIKAYDLKDRIISGEVRLINMENQYVQSIG